MPTYRQLNSSKFQNIFLFFFLDRDKLALNILYITFDFTSLW